MSGTIALQQMNGPSRLMRKTLRHSSSSVSHTVLLTPAMPALLTRMSILPNALSVASRVFDAPRNDVVIDGEVEDHSVQPPSMICATPVVKALSSLAR